MTSPAHAFLAIDLGAESGRGLLVTLRDGRATFEEIHRFANEPVQILGTLHWDAPRLFLEILQCLRTASHHCRQRREPLASVGIDTWGVDYALLGKTGDLLGNPVHYRDARLDGIQERVLDRVSADLIFEETGLQFLSLNTLFQLEAEKERDPQRLRRAHRLLFMPDLFHYFLTGRQITERTIASTSQLWNPRTGDWSQRLLEALDIPAELLPPIHAPGTVVGNVREDIARELELEEPLPVVAGASHDTAAAIAATPVDPAAPLPHDTTWAYLSSGTWSLMGIELDAPRITGDVRSECFTNEGGVENTIRFLRNLGGLWLVQESRREWARAGRDLDYETLTRLADGAKPLRSLVPPEHERFYLPGDMPTRIREYCRETGQPMPGDEGAVVRCALESLALTYRDNADRIERLTGRRVGRLHVVGGGSKNPLLNQLTADALGAEVVAGPSEATALGNALMQAVALGVLPDLAALRRVVRESFPTESFPPRTKLEGAWSEAAARFDALPR